MYDKTLNQLTRKHPQANNNALNTFRNHLFNSTSIEGVGPFTALAKVKKHNNEDNVINMENMFSLEMRNTETDSDSSFDRVPSYGSPP